MIDPVRLVAMQRLVRLSAIVEAELSNVSSPIVHMLAMARDEAADAINDLVAAEPSDPDVIRVIQNKIIRFDDLVRWLHAIVAKGFEHDREIQGDERDEYADLLAFTPDGHGPLDQEEAEEAGLMERMPHDA